MNYGSSVESTPYGFSALTERPQRIRIGDFAGQPFTLDENAWECLNPHCESPDSLVLGPPFPSVAPNRHIFWHNPDATTSAIGISPPPHWQKIPEAEIEKYAQKCRIFFYRPNLRIDPRFWTPILGKLEGQTWRQDKTFTAWLPGNNTQLLHRELFEALAKAGFARICTAETPNIRTLAQSLDHALPSLAISVNFRGLDAVGRVFSLLNEAGVPLAIWLVDNPFNLLQAIPHPWWQEANVFVTDPGFLAPLARYGAKHAHFLPLAASSHMFREPGEPEPAALFVGRSAFPDQKSYFAGLRLPEPILATAKMLLKKNAAGTSRILPDFHWWAKELDAPLWPGKKERLVAFGADTVNALYRAQWLATSAFSNLRIIGDSAWRTLLPGREILSPVDYYGQLPDLYGRAICVLNVTGLLMPGSLNQRHFDVWAAGGYLITNDSPGLDLFPEELVRPMALAVPNDVIGKIDRLRENLPRRLTLVKDWQKLIKKAHTYDVRLKELCDLLAVQLPRDRTRGLEI